MQGYQDFMNLANLGHFMSTSQKLEENAAIFCKTKADPVTCFADNVWSSNISDPLPSNLSGVLTKYSASSSLMDYLNNNTSFGEARLMAQTTPKKLDRLAPSGPSYAFVSIYDRVMSNSNYSDTVKGLTKELYNQISTIYDKDFILTNYMDEPDALSDWGYWNPNTGAVEGFPLTNSEFNVDALLNPNTSTASNFNNTLICAAGQLPDDGTKCN